MDGACANGLCGGLGEAACADGGGCTAPLTYEATGCAACGGLLQPSCGAAAGRYCVPPYVCDATYACVPCGAAAQPCCPGDVCDGGLVCDDDPATCH